MKNTAIIFLLFSLNVCQAQPSGPSAYLTDSMSDLPLASIEEGLFDSNDALQITLRGDIRNLLKNRSGKSKNFPFILSYIKADNSIYSMPIDVKTRGHFRRIKGNCKYPPLLIQFQQNGPQIPSVFKEQNKLKLVMPCKDDSYIIREWLAYRLYNLVTPYSFKARLVKVSLLDTEKKVDSTPFYGILLEEEPQMASRNQMIPVERDLKPIQTQREAFLSMAVFQYLIGNTDWSVEFLQNIKLIAADSNSIPYAVPYDFDHSGIVNAPYAHPAEALEMKSIRERRYRGYCVYHLEKFEPTIAQFNALKADIYQLYTRCALLDDKYVKSTLRFLDEFYATINDTKSWQNAFAYPCDPKGTAGVVIKGLKQD